MGKTDSLVDCTGGGDIKINVGRRWVCIKANEKCPSDKNIIRECVVILKAYTNALVDDLGRRFACTGIVTDLLNVFDLKCAPQAADFKFCPDRLKRLAEFFKVEAAALDTALRRLHFLRADCVCFGIVPKCVSTCG